VRRQRITASGWRVFSASSLSLLKSVNYRESSGIFLCDRRTVGRPDHHLLSFPCARCGFAAERQWNSKLVALRHQLIALAASAFIPPTGSVVLSKQGFGQSVPVESSDERKWVSVDGRAEARTGRLSITVSKTLRARTRIDLLVIPFVSTHMEILPMDILALDILPLAGLLFDMYLRLEMHLRLRL
jgi:hypothetical protein